MKIWHSTYQLYPKNLLNSLSKQKYRKGALLHFLFENGNVGYSDLCPMSEMGDRTIEQELRNISRRKWEGLAERSLYFAQKDAEARSQGQSLYPPNIKIKNHFLISGIIGFEQKRVAELQNNGFSEFKVKMGRDLEKETESLKLFVENLGTQSHLRLDFNAILSRERFESWFDKNQKWLRSKLEFIEDPFVYEGAAWKSVSHRYGIRLALDQCADPVSVQAEGAEVIVIKPAKQNAEEIIKHFKNSSKKFVFTHYLDFPIGQMSAFYEAQRLYPLVKDQTLACGLQLQDIYEDFTFQTAIRNDGPYVLPPEGKGLGFDSLLQTIEWKELV